MSIAEQIHEHVQKLPTPYQAEVLDFVEFLLLKQQKESEQDDERAWSSLSLQMAMRDMEDEEAPTYTMEDMKVVFS